MPKALTSVKVELDLLMQARELQVDVDRAAEAGLRYAVEEAASRAAHKPAGGRNGAPARRRGRT